MIKLPNVTLLSVAGQNYLVDPTVAALEYCQRKISFGCTKILSPSTRDNKSSTVEYVEIPPTDLEGYSRLCVEQLYKFVDTEFCLMVQKDGFIINPDLWTDEFLEYDYIGAPWGHGWRNRVGNGGFCLRSKKFLECSSKLLYDANLQHLDYQLPGHQPTPEDWFLCVHNFEHMKENGIRFPNVELGLRFAVEYSREEKKFNPQDASTYQSFGFHGSFNTGAMELLN